MEGEIKNFIVVWLTVLSCLCYCRTIGKFIPKGTTRLLTFLPIISLFFFLHLNLTSIHLGSTACFFTAWLANFKLLLFAFGKGPLSPPPPPPNYNKKPIEISFSNFVLIACLPIKIHHYPLPQNKEESPNKEIKENPSHNFLKSPLGFATKVVFGAISLKLDEVKEHLHPHIVMLIFCMRIYISLELLLAMMTALARAVGRVELEPPFDEPYLSSSLQDFWGRRWNLIVSGILRPTVYDPVRWIAGRSIIGRKWAPIPAIMATFLVSGLMHELVFYNMGRTKPTWEITSFFLIHGACLVVEIGVKKAVNGKFRLPPIVSGPLVVAFVVATASRLFVPAFYRFNNDVRVKREMVVTFEFVKAIGSNIFDRFK